MEYIPTSMNETPSKQYYCEIHGTHNNLILSQQINHLHCSSAIVKCLILTYHLYKLLTISTVGNFNGAENNDEYAYDLLLPDY